MRPDVVQLREFYATGLGQMARRYVGRLVREAWPDCKGLAVLGLGFAVPFLRPLLDEAQRVIAVMPAAQGVLRWPPPTEQPSHVCLADETDLPLPDESMDRVLVVHSLENSDDVRPMLRECWRVMPSTGRLLLVVPNRLGIWARLERTPFGHGRPYTPPQLVSLLKENLFTPLSVRSCLFTPPLRWKVMLRSAPAFENLGQRGFGVGGVLVAEASKQIYAAVRPMALARRRALTARSTDGR